MVLGMDPIGGSRTAGCITCRDADFVDEPQEMFGQVGRAEGVAADARWLPSGGDRGAGPGAICATVQVERGRRRGAADGDVIPRVERHRRVALP